jgi:RNA polymerase sigma-70 factor (sigma-E family)
MSTNNLLAAPAATLGMTKAGGTTVTAGWGDQAVVAAYHQHYGSLVRQAARLVRDTPTAEDVVQDSFVAMHTTGPQLNNGAKVLAYLRRCVTNRSLSVLRHRAVADQYRPAPGPDMPSAEDSALARLGRTAMISALAGLPARQRQVLALRYLADMSEAQVAAFLGISRGAVKTHTARALASLRQVLPTLYAREASTWLSVRLGDAPVHGLDGLGFRGV